MPETLAPFRRRLDPDWMEKRVAIQSAAAMAEGLLSPAPLLVDTFPSEPGSQRVTDATTLDKAPKKPVIPSRASARSAPEPPRP